MVFANDAHIEHVKAVKSGSSWTFHVTIRHNDTGWDHYADGWRVVDEQGKELGMRVLYHPHETEQPFTRSLSGVNIPKGTTIVYVEARDKVHGWNKDKVRIDLTTSKGDRYEVVR
jgi:hypothetical protein